MTGTTLFAPSGVVASNVRFATSFRARRRGVLGAAQLGPDDALVIERCRQVHSFGVGYDLDVVFCDRDLVVLHVETLLPEGKSQRIRGAKRCIELAGGRAAESGIVAGVRLELSS